MAKNPYQGDDVDPFSGARDEEGDIKRDSKEDSERDARESAVSGALKKSRPKPKPKLNKAEPAKAETKPETKKERPSLFRRTVAALGGVKLPQDPGPEKEKEKSTTRPKPVSTAAAIQAKNMGYKKGGTVSSASKRADGIAIKGKTKGRFV